MITKQASYDAVTALGINEQSAAYIARILFALQCDSDSSARIEEVVSEFVENALMLSRGLVTIDDVFRSVEELKKLFIWMKLKYKVMPAEIDLSAHLDTVGRILTRTFEWV